jgi:ribokinase
MDLITKLQNLKESTQSIEVKDLCDVYISELKNGNSSINESQIAETIESKIEPSISPIEALRNEELERSRSRAKMISESWGGMNSFSTSKNAGSYVDGKEEEKNSSEIESKINESLTEMAKFDKAAGSFIEYNKDENLGIFESNLKLTKKALEIAKAEGVKTILNPAPAVEQLPAEIYKLVDVFCPNETETEILTKGSTKSLSEAKAQAKVLLARGVKTVIITLGERGCLIVDNEGDTHIPAPAVKAIDTVGAGDCFVGSLAHFLAKGLTMPAAAHRAVNIASLSVQAKGTQTSFPEAKDLPRELIEF